MHDNLLKPNWFEWPPIPDNLFTSESETEEYIEVENDSDFELEESLEMNDSDGEAWSENSDSKE